MKIPEKLSKLDKKFLKEIHRGFLEAAIAEGRIDPRTKTDEQLWEYVTAKIISGDWTMTLDHTADLLSQARQNAKNENYELACLFYSTWLEHFLNKMIHSLAIRNNFSNAEAASLIRETQLKGKLLWLHLVFRNKPPKKSYLDMIKLISERRNQYIHYKWTTHNPNEPRDDYKVSLEKIELLVKHLQQFESRYFLHHQKRRARYHGNL